MVRKDSIEVSSKVPLRDHLKVPGKTFQQTYQGKVLWIVNHFLKRDWKKLKVLEFNSRKQCQSMLSADPQVQKLNLL